MSDQTPTVSSPGEQDFSLETIRQDLTNPDLGFHVLKGFYSRAEAQWLQDDCVGFLSSGPVRHTRINTDDIEDYIHPRSHDTQARTRRIYRYLHNHPADQVGQLLNRALLLRAEIEAGWIKDPTYAHERLVLQDYVIFTAYQAGSGMLPKHQDYDGPAPFPLIQFWVLLSDPTRDYSQGNLILHSHSGHAYAAERELGLEPGDALIFDKSLQHEVELTEAGAADGAGRWTVLIGARAPRDSRLRAAAKKLMFSPALYPLTQWVQRRLGKR